MSDKKQYQINKEKGNETKFESLNMSYNEWHSIVIGANIGFLTSLVISITPTPFSIVSYFILLDKALSVTGWSLTSQIMKISPKNYAFLYTVRSEPWYYLTAITIFFIITRLVLQIY